MQRLPDPAVAAVASVASRCRRMPHCCDSALRPDRNERSPHAAENCRYAQSGPSVPSVKSVSPGQCDGQAATGTLTAAAGGAHGDPIGELGQIHERLLCGPGLTGGNRPGAVLLSVPRKRTVSCLVDPKLPSARVGPAVLGQATLDGISDPIPVHDPWNRRSRSRGRRTSASTSDASEDVCCARPGCTAAVDMPAADRPHCNAVSVAATARLPFMVISCVRSGPAR